MLKGERASRPTYLKHKPKSAGVQKAYHEIYRQDCAQKTVPLVGLPDALGHEPALIRSLAHDRIVEVWEAQYDPQKRDSVTFVMPWFPGGSAQDALELRHQFSISEAITITIDVAHALQYLHTDVGILHRDVKPGNILLDVGRCRGWLTDFGGAARLEHGRTDLDGYTELYLDPAASLATAMTVGSDLYSLGFSLFELLNGELPVDQVGAPKIDKRLANGQAPLPARYLSHQPHVPRALRVIVNRLIDPKGRRRPSSLPG